MKYLPKTALAALLLSPVAFAQTARDQVRLDDVTVSNTADGFDISMQGEGMLRVAMWVDERDGANTSDDAIWCAVSTDRGITFGPEISVYDQSFAAVDIDDARLAVSNGVIYITFDDDRSGSTNPTAVLMRSDDLGATWTETVLGLDFNNPEIFVDGDNVLILMYDDSASTHILHAYWSTDQGLSFNAGAPLSGGDVDTDGWSGLVDGDNAYAVWFDDGVNSGDNDLYFSSSIAGGAWSAPVRVDQDVSGLGDVDVFPKIAIGGGNIYVAYMEDGRNGGSTSQDEAYFCVSSDGGASWTETSLSPVGQDADYMNLAAEGDTVAVTWADDFNAAYDSANVIVSTDGGSTFSFPYTVPSVGGAGLDDHQHMNVFIEGGRILLAFESDAYTASSLDEWPAYCFSVDAGASWNGPFVMGNGFAADEDIDTEGTAWHYADGSLCGMWQTDGDYGPIRSAIFAGGIRFPFVDAVNNGNNTVTFSMGGADATLGTPSFARWAASNVLGMVAHPENAAEMLGLGSSFALNYTLNRPRNFAAPIAADGSASLTFGTGATAGTFYVQGWVNVGPSISGGTTTSDLVAVTL